MHGPHFYLALCNFEGLYGCSWNFGGHVHHLGKEKQMLFNVLSKDVHTTSSIVCGITFQIMTEEYGFPGIYICSYKSYTLTLASLH